MVWIGHIGMLGAAGETLALVGFGLLWTYRAPAREWIREVLEIWSGEVFGRDPHLSDPIYRRSRPRRPPNAVALVSAVALLFIGQILFLIDLTFQVF